MEYRKSFLRTTGLVVNFLAALAIFVILPISAEGVDEETEGVYHKPVSIGVPAQQPAIYSSAENERLSITTENSLPEESLAFLNLVKDLLSPKSHVAFELVELPSRDYGLIILNSWLSVMIDIPRSDVIDQTWHEIPEKARWLSQSSIAPAEKLDKTLKENFSLSLNQVYNPPQPPFYSNLRGIYWDKFGQQYLLVFTFELDISNNLCTKATVNILDAKIVHESETRCKTR